MRLTPGSFLGMPVRKRSTFGFIFTEYKYGPSTKLSAHSHELPYFSFVLAGSYEERCSTGQSQNCDAQVALYHPPEERHSNAFSMQGGHILSVEIPHDCLGRARDYELAVAQRTVFENGPAKAWRRRAYAAFTNPRPASDFILHAIAMELLYELPCRMPLRPERNVPGWLLQAIDIVHSEFHQPSNLSSIAERVGTHPVHLARTFKVYRGKTLAEYARDLRVAYAMEAILKTEKPLATIASESGFSDQSHLGRAIKAYTGVTPRQFRLSRRR